MDPKQNEISKRLFLGLPENTRKIDKSTEENQLSNSLIDDHEISLKEKFLFYCMSPAFLVNPGCVQEQKQPLLRSSYIWFSSE